MNRRSHRTPVTLLLIPFTFAFASPSDTNTSDTPEVFPQVEIQINGNKSVETSAVEEAIGITRPSFFEFYKDDKGMIKKSFIPTLDETLKGFYESEGFYDATFAIKQEKSPLQVTINENKPVKITSLQIQSDYNLTQITILHKGATFRAKDFIEYKAAIVKELMNEGYCSHDLDTKAYIDLDKREADIKVILKKGGICTFGKTNVDGLKSIDSKIISSRVVAKEGERFSTEKIKDSYDALYGLDAFDSVIINFDRKFYNVVPLDVTVSEVEKPYYFIAGAGYDTNVGPRVQASLTRKNFLGNARKVGIKAAYSPIEYLAEINTFMPGTFFIFDFPIDVGGELGYSNLEFEGFKEQKGYFKTYLGYVNKDIRINLGLGIENIDITALEDYDTTTLTKAINEGSFFLYYPYVQFTYDGRDSKLNPKYGFYFSALVEYGLSDNSDASSFIRTLVEGRAIHTFGNLTLASVIKAGVVDVEANDLPASKFLFSGGAYTNRAYRYNELGIVLSPTEYDINGAKSMLNITFEADYPIWGDLYGAVFSDNTLLNPESYDFDGEYISSAGLGVRYMTPIGPIKIDVGFNVNDTTQYGIHFQIGQSF